VVILSNGDRFSPWPRSSARDFGVGAPKSGISVSDFVQAAPCRAGFPPQADMELRAPHPESAYSAPDLLGNYRWAQPVIDPGCDLID
jgi:hypothetical protein